jgi:3-hydroxyisobutyrate dehydrogenase-like beta-hydroxyacid dehydrogenase
MSLRVGVVGLGLMGGSVAEHLVDEGFDVYGYDLSPDARDAAAAVGVTVEENGAAVAQQVDVVLTSLPNPEIVREAYLGEDGIASGTSDFVAVDISTIDPDTTTELAADLEERGVTLVDSPVSGGPEEAARGTLTTLVGGPDDVVESPPVSTVIDAISNASFHIGDVGAGHTAKLLNNVMSMGNLMLAMEAVAVGAERGLDGARLLDALSNAGGASNQLVKRLPRVLNRNFEAGFPVSLARKDLGLALDAGQGSDNSMPVTALVHQLYTRAVREGHGDEDAGAVAKLFEREGALIESDEHVDESFEGY